MQRAQARGVRILQIDLEPTTTTDGYIGADWTEIDRTAAKACENVTSGNCDLLISYDVPLQGDALNVEIARLLRPDAPAGETRRFASTL